MSIFDKRTAVKPYEYPEVIKFREAIKFSRWDISEFDFTIDVNDYHTKLNDTEKEVVRKTLLAISQIEVSVKDFWGDIGKMLPKKEIKGVGATFSENEETHFESYSKLLEVLGFNNEFESLLENEVIEGRVNYLTKYLRNSGENAQQFFVLKLALFTLLVENTSLFGQFAIIKSFAKRKQYLKEVDTVIDATMKEEIVHGLFGTHLINTIKKEFPEWFDEHFYDKIYRACKKALDAEIKIVDWIFEKGEITSVSKNTIIEFIKHRINDSLKGIGGKQLFDVDESALEDIYWLIESIYGYIRNDFFDTASPNYTKFNKKVSRKNLFKK